MSQQDHVENSAAEHGLDGCHSNMSPSSPNGQPFRVPGRRTRTTSEYVHCLLLHRVVSLHNSNKYCQTPNYIYMSHLLAGITHTYETMVLVSFGEVMELFVPSWHSEREIIEKTVLPWTWAKASSLDEGLHSLSSQCFCVCQGGSYAMIRSVCLSVILSVCKITAKVISLFH